MGLRLKTEKVIVKDLTNIVTEAKSSIEQQATLIALKVSQEVYNSLVDRVESTEASISLQAGEIASKVTTTTFNSLNDRVGSAESAITQQANQIASKVASTDFNGNTVASLINQTATTIKLQAKKITLEGLITANNNFKVLPDGSIEAVNAKLSGAITATKMISPTGNAYFAEVGVTGGIAGLGLYDTTRASTPYFRVVEEVLGSSFNGFKLLDNQGRIRLLASGAITSIFGSNPNTYIEVSSSMINIIVNNRLVKQYI